MKVEKLCDSLAGNPCYCLTITTDVKNTDVKMNEQEIWEFKSKSGEFIANDDFKPRNKHNKQVIVLTSRVHPGESNS